MSDNQATKPKNSEDAVVGSSATVSARSYRKFAVALTLVLLIGGIGGYQLYQWHQHEKLKASVAGLTGVQQAQTLSDAGHYGVAQGILQAQLDKATSKQAKLDIYYQQVGLALQFKNFKDADKYAKAAENLDAGSTTPYVALAHTAENQGDKSAARQYWQQAIGHLDKNDPAYNLKLHDYQSSLDSLK